MPVAALPDRPSLMTRALVGSLVVHGVVVVVASLPMVRQAMNAWQAAAERRAVEGAVAPPLPVEVEVVMPEVTVVRPQPQPAEEFIRTDGLPEAKPEPGKRRFISDRDTRAASPLAADAAATEAQPTQEGVDIPVVEVIRREQSDGEDEALPPSALAAAGAQSPPPPPEAAEAPAQPPAPEATNPPPTPSTLPAPAPAMTEAATPLPPQPEGVPEPVEERLALARESEVSVKVDPARPRAAAPATPPPAPPTPRAALRDPEVASRPPAPKPPPRPPESTPPAGFSGLRTPTRLRGTISNQGPASVDAEDTPTGRYMKQVTGAIEKEWHRKRRMNRDFVTFGTIKLEFYVNARGEVQNLTIKNRSGANAVMQDFTLNAVLDAAIPPMPPGLDEILDREQLLISYDIIVY